MSSAPATRRDHANALRRQAVEMRLAGATLRAIRDATGLSTPTILAAHKAFTQGGWGAVAVRGPGRPEGDGRVLTTHQDAAMRRRAREALPPDDRLWTADTLRADAQRALGLDIGERTLQRYLRRWGLHWPLLRTAAAATAAGRDWLQNVHPGMVQQAHASRQQLVWVAVHKDTQGAPGTWLLVAQTPRGQYAWMPAAAIGDVRTWTDFLGRLAATWPGELRVLLNGPSPDAPALRAWLDTRPRLHVVACPVALSASPPAVTLANPPSPSTPSPRPPMNQHQQLTHLQRLEAEAIHIMREVVAECDRPVMLYSIGKDSACMLHLARKAFHPAPPPFPLLHVDTTWKFREMYAMRERMPREAGMELLVWQNPEAKRLGINPFEHGSQIHTDMWKTQGLKQALDHHGFDAAFGGARRDEEKSRAKERVFSFRTAQHRWDPKQQRPELWNLYNARKHKGESIRVFPMSNWTELDIWQYIHLENIPIVPLYFAKERPVVQRDGTLIMVDDDRMPLRPNEVPVMRKVRFRTLGCYPLSGAVESEAESLTAIIQEMLLARTSERQGRLIDHDQSASMEKKKQEGYF